MSAGPDYLLCHVAHMNLNDEYLPYKHIIGQVILDVSELPTTLFLLSTVL